MIIVPEMSITVGLLGQLRRGAQFDVPPQHEAIANRLLECGAATLAGESPAPPVSTDAAPVPHVQRRPLAPCKHCGESYQDHGSASFSTATDVRCGHIRRGFERGTGVAPTPRSASFTYDRVTPADLAASSVAPAPVPPLGDARCGACHEPKSKHVAGTGRRSVGPTDADCAGLLQAWRPE